MADSDKKQNEGKINTTAVVVISIVVVIIIGAVVLYFVMHNKNKKIATANESLNSAFSSSGRD